MSTQEFSYKIFFKNFLIFWLVLANLDILSLIFYKKATMVNEIISIYFVMFGSIAIPYLILRFNATKTLLPMLLISFMSYGISQRISRDYNGFFLWLSSVFKTQMNHYQFEMLLIGFGVSLSAIAFFYIKKTLGKNVFKVALLSMILPIGALVTFIEYKYIVVGGMANIHESKSLHHKIMSDSKVVNLLDYCDSNPGYACYKDGKYSNDNDPNTKYTGESIPDFLKSTASKIVGGSGIKTQISSQNFYHHLENLEVNLVSFGEADDSKVVIRENVTKTYSNVKRLFLWFNNFFLVLWFFVLPLFVVIHQTRKGKMYGFFRK